MKPPEIDVGIDECAKYVRLALEQKYGIKIEPCHAWDMKYNPDLIVVWSKIIPLNSYDFREIVRKGDVLGIYNPLKQAYDRGMRRI